jgi:hypothetical protein
MQVSGINTVVHDATPTHDARGRTQKYDKHVQILLQQHVIDGAQSRVWDP